MSDISHKEKRIIEYTAVALILILGIIFSQRLTGSEADFSRRIFAGLVKGQPSVRKLIDWSKFEAIGFSVAQEYAKLPGPKDKTAYEISFIKNFARGFKGTGARLGAFTRWRVQSRGLEQIVVAADYPDKAKTLLFYIEKMGKPKLVKVEWER